MALNYVLSFCKITAASKIFTRSFYLPLLKPVTPKDVIRTFRITGKWILATKYDHYIPVLLNHTKKRSKNSKDFGKVPHKNSDDFRYVSPILDPENENYKILFELLHVENGENLFVYTIEDKKYHLVIASAFEDAIREGQIIDVLISQRNDKILIKLKDSKKIPVELNTYSGKNGLLKGEGATSEEEEKNHHHGRFTMSIAKIFEDKERESEEWERELQRIVEKRQKKAYENSYEYDEMVRESVSKLDWKKFEKEARKVIEQVNDPISERNFLMEVEDFELTKYANETLKINGLEQLPTLKEINEVIKSLPTAIPHKITAENKRRVSGVKITLPTGKECFITGQMVHTDDGEIFVPGQTVETENGCEYVPGITVRMDGSPTLVAGLIMAEEEREPMFLPADASVTASGQLTFTSEVEERPKVALENKKEKYQFKTSFARIGEEEEEVKVVEEPQEEVKKKKKKKKTKKPKPEIQVEIIQEIQETPKEEQQQQEPSPQKEEDLEKQRREEFERLRQLLLDDGMDELITSVEQKTNNLNQKLEELRKLRINLTNNSINYITITDALSVSSTITTDQDTSERLAEILLTLTRRTASFRDKNSIKPENVCNPCQNFFSDAEEKLERSSETLRVILKKAVVAANEVFKSRPKDQLMALRAIAEIMVDTLKRDENLVLELCEIMKTCLERNEVCTGIFRQLTSVVAEDKLEKVKEALDVGEGVVEAIGELLGEESDVFKVAFLRVCKNRRDLSEEIITKVTGLIDELTIGTIRDVIKKVLDYSSSEYLKNLISNLQKDKLKEFFLDATSFAKILSQQQIQDTLTSMTSNCTPNLTPIASDTLLLDFLKRIWLLRLLTEKDFYLRAALERIRKNPDCGKTDPRIRQLIRETAFLISGTPKPLTTSRQIPLRLMQTQNVLAIEDFLTQRSTFEYPLLVSRQGLQVVIPEEAQRGVLAGRVPYVMLDESGSSSFRPVSELGGLKMGRNGGGGKLQGQVRKLCKRLLGSRRRVA